MSQQKHPKPPKLKTVLVTGGAGYVGGVLVPQLLADGYRVRVLDLYLFGREVLSSVAEHPQLSQVHGDIRDEQLLADVLAGCDAVIHLAAVSNDPSFDLDPQLGRSINYDAFGPLVQLAKQAGVRRFIFASSSSVYGISDAPHVTEEHPLKPLTEYSRYKAICEPILLDELSADFTPIVVRPATVCGLSPRQRFDVVVNLLANQALAGGPIRVFGGDQQRPNLHIDDMADAYRHFLVQPAARVAGKVFNVGAENHTVRQIAETVRDVVAEETGIATEIITTPSDDNRSYHISAEKIRRELGFVPKRSVADAVRDLCRAFAAGQFEGAADDPRYVNVRQLQEIGLS